MTLKDIIAEVDRSFWKKETLFGYHKDFFIGLADKYELRFWRDDPEYPCQISVKGYSPVYYC
jgi:hypothetical protein